MTSMLHLGEGFDLPVEAVTETIAVLASKGAGKTYLASVLVEQLYKAGAPVVVIDPVGVFWGLRSDEAGTGPGLPFVVFGGAHADVPLEVGSGRLLADLVVNERVPAILDLSGLRSAQRLDIVADFAEEIYHRNREPLHLVIDESAMFAPQRMRPGITRVLGAIDDLVRLGRAHGIGVTMTTQRPSVLNKDILTQASVLVAMRMSAPQDIGAIDDWVRGHAEAAQAREMRESLPSLKTGQAWVWSPSWLEVHRKVQVRQRRTFDSSATPKLGASVVVPRQLAPVDLQALTKRMSAALQQAELQDPARLRARVAELEGQLREARKNVPAAPAEVVRVEVPVPVLEEAQLTRLETALAGLRSHTQQVDDLAQQLREQVRQARQIQPATPPAPASLTAAEPRSAQPAGAGSPTGPAAPADPTPPVPKVASGRSRPGRQTTPQGSSTSTPSRLSPHLPAPAGQGEERLPKAQRAILTVLAQHGTRSPQQVALLTRYSATSGGFRNALFTLRSAGLATGHAELTITPAGLRALGAWTALPTGPELVEWWCGFLGKAERTVLRVLVEQHPRAVPVGEVAERTGYSATSGGFRNALSKLRTLGLVTGRGEVRAADSLLAA